MFISPARAACWDSHLRVIQSVLDSSSNTSTSWDITFILEDDIDMELDIRRRLRPLWERLPVDWDIVFLGHCWSNEGIYDALSDIQTHLHPSRAPQCTHAYALSPLGARRLYEHLTYPPFAFSRAIDQAYAWLVKSGRLRAYSVVPGVMVQRVEEAGWLEWLWNWFSGKETGKASDIWGTSGGATRWRDELVNGVFSGKDGVLRRKY
ncbi:hypothetical protein Moror_10082 [Moniliophthora roreri MCA 2997]|uniref:Glycosyltransferase family 25 protein n=1 Tax=Moniliophthora roreri (strain MCA 2997) TaxID=1381753 RepID=V2WZ96_MONRO|nr:hypothetical protein Moror_10082 [Moniliophthora roreri MCA 2997]